MPHTGLPCRPLAWGIQPQAEGPVPTQASNHPLFSVCPALGKQPLCSAPSLLPSASFGGTSVHSAASVSSPRLHYPRGWRRPDQASPLWGFSQTAWLPPLLFCSDPYTQNSGVRLLGFSNLYGKPWVPDKFRLITAPSTGNAHPHVRNKASGAQRVRRLETKSPTPTPYSVP